MSSKYGILLAVSSLPSNHGIGDFGDNAYRFISFLKDYNYSYWQVLPLNPLGPGNSPYMSTCSEAIEPLYISLDCLVKDGYLKDVPNYRKSSSRVDYQKVKKFKYKYLYKAYLSFIKDNQYKLDNFIKDNKWVKRYALFTYLRVKNNLVSWPNWDEKDKFYNEKKGFIKGKEKQCYFYVFLQYIAYKQYKKLYKFAKENDIKIIADCPFYVGIDSTDCYFNKDLFMFDENYHPTLVSGCPPDDFSDDGQLWGTPIYNFEKMKEDNYSFLVNRLGYIASTCDYLRLDHFRAFDTYCVIPGDDKNARRGEWVNGPSYDFFRCLYKKYPSINLIAEDLGELLDSVHALRDYYYLPGMYVTQFTMFDEKEPKSDNKILYSGTHDNNTLKGWLHSLSKAELKIIKKKLHVKSHLLDALFSYAWNMPSKLSIFPLQDILGLSEKSRMNTPGTLGSPNWEYKLKDFDFINHIKYGFKKEK